MTDNERKLAELVGDMGQSGEPEDRATLFTHLMNAASVIFIQSAAPTSAPGEYQEAEKLFLELAKRSLEHVHEVAQAHRAQKNAEVS